MRGLDLSGAAMPQAVLVGADLTTTTFTGASFDRVVLVGRSSRASTSADDPEGARSSWTAMAGADLRGADVSACNFKGRATHQREARRVRGATCSSPARRPRGSMLCAGRRSRSPSSSRPTSRAPSSRAPTSRRGASTARSAGARFDGCDLTYSDFPGRLSSRADFSGASLFRTRFHRPTSAGRCSPTGALALGDDAPRGRGAAGPRATNPKAPSHHGQPRPPPPQRVSVTSPAPSPSSARGHPRADAGGSSPARGR